MNFFTEYISAMKSQGLYRQNQVYQPASASHVAFGGREYLMLASNNYLGLTHHTKVKAAAIKAIEQYGTGAGGARLTTGTHPLYEALERDLAAFKGTEAAVAFNTGYMANLGTISAVMGKDDVIFSDALNHASIIDGCRLSGATRVIFPHSDMDKLKELIETTPCRGKRMIVVDGVFSMDGDIAPLEQIVKIAKEYQALVMVDDAHATGVLGLGRGTAAHFGLEDEVAIQMGTLSKALGAEGAYVAGKKELIDFLINKARSYIFSTALAPATIAAAHAALKEVMYSSTLVERLLENGRFMRAELTKYGVQVNQAETPIIPIIVGSAEKATTISNRLNQQGIILSAIRPPTVPVGESRLRLTVSTAHNQTDLAIAAKKIAKALQDEGMD
ncbi:MAG: 8-amino-7-oxononanoate synthase [Firmicutes bacterium]|nr:8-amino-7-oxononanoate synthase [Bacillota bacterium]